MSQPDFLYELFEDFMDDPANQDFSMDNGLVCRWLTGQAKISPKISAYYSKPSNQKKLAETIHQNLLPLMSDCNMAMQDIYTLFIQDDTISDAKKKNLASLYKPASSRLLFLAKLISFGMERQFIKRDTKNQKLLAGGALSPIVLDYIMDSEVPKPCRHFIGRDKELEELYTMLEENRHVFLCGIAGIGKSELAKAYAKHYKKHYTNILYVEYTGDLHQDITDMDFIDDPPEISEQERFQRHNRFLRSLKSDTLLIIDNFNVLKYDKSRYLLIDHLIIDLSLKKIVIYDNTLQESIHNLFDNIEKISILSNDDTKIITIINKDNKEMDISIDKFNNIKNIKLINCFNIQDNFLKTSAFIESCSLPNTITIGNNFLRSNYMLHNIYAPTLEIIQDDFLALNGLLKDLNLPSLKEVGNNFLKTNEVLDFINVSSLEIIKDNFLRDNKNLRKLFLPNIKYTGKYMLDSNRFVKITQTERSK